MMKGHTTIILTNVETGEQEIHEDDNLVTDALDKIINIAMGMNRAPNSDILPIATNALGGLMLFDGAIEESEDNIHFPADVHLVAYAAQDTNTSDKNRGSYNALESGKTDTGYVSVWDFGTSQANGTIRAVARTHVYGGANPIRYYKSNIQATTLAGVPTTDSDWCPVRYADGYVYMLKGNTTTHQMRLARVRIPMTRFGVADYSDMARTYEVIASWDTEVFTYTYTPGSGSPRDITVYADNPLMYEDGRDGFIYCMFYGVQNTYRPTDYNYDINYFTVRYDDGSYEKSETVRANSGLGYRGMVTDYVLYAGRIWGHVNHGVLYRVGSTQKLIQIIPLDNVASFQTVRVVEDESSDYVAGLAYTSPHDGGIWFEIYHYTASSYEYRNGILYPDGEQVQIEVTGESAAGSLKQYLRTSDDDLTVWGISSNTAAGSYITRDYVTNYLGTINNLASAINKNAAQTMKVIYTLTDIDE